MKITNGFRKFLGIYVFIFVMLSSIICAIIPIIPYLITENGNFLWILFITIPLGVLIMDKTWPHSENYNKMCEKWL